jgi:CheY-like chemotaxis protein
VEDTGSGISLAEQENLFQPFTQSKSGRDKKEGTGLGLAISNQFVHKLGGEIRMNSEVNKGTIFRFMIKAEEVQVSDIESVKPILRIKGLKIPPNKKIDQQFRILVVDDTSDNRALLCKLLKNVGFLVKEANDGQQAVERSMVWRPHLIWMDMRMPVMNGYEATKTIRAQTQGWSPQKQPVIIALSASAFEEDRVAMLAAGCHDFVRRPFRESEIFQKISQHLGLEYIYETTEEKSDSNSEATELSPEDLPTQIHGLPKRIVTELKTATELSDMEQMNQLVTEITAINKELGKPLKNLIDSFQYDRILKLLGKDEATDK